MPAKENKIGFFIMSGYYLVMRTKKVILIITTIFVISMSIVFVVFIRIPTPDFQVNRDFQNAIIGCDKIIIRDGCYDPNQKYYSNNIIKIITDPCAISRLLNAIQFSTLQRKRVCECLGWPAIDFYKNGQIIMVTAIKHNQALCATIRDYDMQFTSKTEMFFENLTAEPNFPKEE
jgi:hypothetical protein